MYIHYNETTKRVTGWTGFLATAPEEIQPEDATEVVYKKPVFTEPTLILDFAFIFEFDIREYEVRDGAVIHVGKSEEMIQAGIQALLGRYTALVDAHIQAVVDAHNLSAQTAYTNAKGVEAYSKTAEHWDVAWCASLWAFNVQVWNFTRVELLPAFDFTKILTDEEFIALLPIYKGVA